MKTLLITGASRGLGKSCATIAAQMGLDVIVTARSKGSMQDLQKDFDNIEVIASDLSTDEGRTDLASAINRPFTRHNRLLVKGWTIQFSFCHIWL